MNELEAEVVAAARRWFHAEPRSDEEGSAEHDLINAMEALERAEEREQREDRPRAGLPLGGVPSSYPSLLTTPRWEIRGFRSEAEMRTFEARSDFPGWDAL